MSGKSQKEYKYSWRLAIYPNVPFAFGFVYCLLDLRYSYLLLSILILPVAAGMLAVIRRRVRIDETGITHVKLLGTITLRWSDVTQVRLTRFLRILVIRSSVSVDPKVSESDQPRWRRALQKLLYRMREPRIHMGPVMENFGDLVAAVHQHVSEQSPDAKLEMRDVPVKGGSQTQSLVRRIYEVKWVLAATLPLAVCAMALFYFNTWIGTLDQDVRVRESQIRKAGYPVTGRELEQFQISRDDDNAAPVLLAAASVLKGFSGEPYESIGFKLNDPGFSIPEHHADWAHKVVAQNSLVLQLLAEASSRSTCRYSVRYSEGTSAHYSHLPSLRKLCQFLTIRNLVASDKPESDLTENICLIFDVAHSMRNEPTTLGLLVRGSYQRYALHAMQFALRRRTLDDAQILALMARIDRELSSMSLERVLMGERVLTLEMLDEALKDVEKKMGWLTYDHCKSPTSRPLLPPFLTFLGLRQRLLVLDVFESAMTQTKEHDQLQYSDSLAKPFLEARHESDPFARMASLMLDLGSIIPESHFSMMADLHAAKTALYIESYRQKRRNLPPNLREVQSVLKTALPKDPFAGNLLIYRKTDHGYVVYSVGVNRTDDGGKDSPESRRADITFEVRYE